MQWLQWKKSLVDLIKHKKESMNSKMENVNYIVIESKKKEWKQWRKPKGLKELLSVELYILGVWEGEEMEKEKRWWRGQKTYLSK